MVWNGVLPMSIPDGGQKAMICTTELAPPETKNLESALVKLRPLSHLMYPLVI